MSQIKLGNLVSKLDINLKSALEEAAGAAMAQTVTAIEIEHWLVQLIATKESNLMGCLSKQNIDPSVVLSELTQRINRLSTGATGQPTISLATSELMESAWMLASVNYGHQEVTSLHLLLALTQTDNLGMKKFSLAALQTLSTEALNSQILSLIHISEPTRPY